MEVVFKGSGHSPREQGEIEDVLNRLVWRGGYGWEEAPDEVRVLRRLAGGRSASEVLEVIVRTGPREAAKVVKIGPAYELEREHRAFRSHLTRASALFAPIEAATEGTVDASRSGGDRQALVYDHAARFKGAPGGRAETFETVARRAVERGGESLEAAIHALETLFRGIRNDLYDRYEVIQEATAAGELWNLRLGIDLVLEVDRFDAATSTLDRGPVTPEDRDSVRRFSRDIVETSARFDVSPAPDDLLAPGDLLAPNDLVYLRDLRAEWWDEGRLMGESSQESFQIPFRIEVVAAPGESIRRLASRLQTGGRFHVCGRILSVRARSHRARLLEGLPELKEGRSYLEGPGARVPDPFVALPGILKNRRESRLTAVIHGDLNPRNILLVGKDPCLIDYAFTSGGQPLLADFVRLEGLLARDVLPDDLSWAQHVRLQRLLAMASRSGGVAAERCARSLAEKRPELGAAFRLLWTIRQAAQASYPSPFVESWWRDYLQQLFLFAHMTLKWEEQTPAALRATAAMAGVSEEAMSPRYAYDFWSLEDLRRDGLRVLELLGPARARNELVGLARVLQRWNLLDGDPLTRNFEAARARFVRGAFRHKANEVLAELDKDHYVYISLRAYIELKGQLLEARPDRERRSFREMVEDEELSVEGERLRLRADASEERDVLALLAELPAVVLLGDAGAGKSTVARELQYRLAEAVVGRRQGTPRLPLVVRAPEIAARLSESKLKEPASIAEVLGKDLHDALLIGALHVTVDAMNELADESKQQVADWIIALRRVFPCTPIVVCHRQYNYVPGLLPFPVVVLEKVQQDQARNYVFDYLRAHQVPGHEELAERLVHLLLDHPDHVHVRDLAQTPLFLWMIVERYRQTGEPPTGRGRLFEDFSAWYLEERHHAEREAPVVQRFRFEEKAELLGVIGYELVQRSATDLADIELEPLIPADLREIWREMLREIEQSELLQREGSSLRFLHQSFQEFFAARHFLAREAADPENVSRKVLQFGWHDTFTVLLSFAGEAPEIVSRIIETALDVNPVLTARCLRMAEQPDLRLLERFVVAQEAVLRSPEAGTYAYERAARALAEHGRGPARAALLRVGADPAVSYEARCEALGRLSGMPGQARFEPVREKIRVELASLLEQIFQQENPAEVVSAAISAMADAELESLGGYLFDLVQAGDWPLCQWAFVACQRLGLKLTPRAKAAFLRSCEHRLEETERELFQTVVSSHADARNRERIEILQQLARPEHLPLLLRRRFSYGIADSVRSLVNQACRAEGLPPEEAAAAWATLQGLGAKISSLIEQLRSPDELAAVAAAHCLASYYEPLDNAAVTNAAVQYLFEKDTPLARRGLIASLISSQKAHFFLQELEILARLCADACASPQDVESLISLIEAVKRGNGDRGQRLAVTIKSVLMQRGVTALVLRYPWKRFDDEIWISPKGFDVLFASEEEGARAAAEELAAVGSWQLLSCSPSDLAVEGTFAGVRLTRLGTAEQDPVRWPLFANAAARAQAVEMLPLLLDWADRDVLLGTTEFAFDSEFGRFEQARVAQIYRAIGYLVRTLVDRRQPPGAGLQKLRALEATLPQEQDRSLVASITTALGFLGEWEPLLTYLGPGEPSMHKAAWNVFEHWVPKVPEGSLERAQAARWIARRLQTSPGLAPKVRSTLAEIRERLEREIGYHVQGSTIELI